MGVANFTGEAALISKPRRSQLISLQSAKKKEKRIECFIESVCVVDLNILLLHTNAYKLHTNATGLVVKSL